MPLIKKAIKEGDRLKVTETSIDVLNAPSDCDWTRWGMLDDRKSTRMYCFKKDTPNQLYQFLLKDGSYVFEEDFTLSIEGLSAAQNTQKIAMLSTPNFEEVVGIKDKEKGEPILPIPNNYHVYMQKAGTPEHLYQFILKDKTGSFTPNGITRDWFGLKAFPADTDWNRWTMTYDSNHYQLSLPAYVFYAFKKGSNNVLYFGRYGADGDQEVVPKTDPASFYQVYSYDPADHPVDKEGDQYYGQAKCGKLIIEDLPGDLNISDLSMVFDGIDTYLYLLIDANN
ncbi:MAG: hypothetical protein HEP71_08110 [Roseivirga sp.]|nr:hypothetical protein [Roseivirga sp.]